MELCPILFLEFHQIKGTINYLKNDKDKLHYCELELKGVTLQLKMENFSFLANADDIKLEALTYYKNCFSNKDLANITHLLYLTTKLRFLLHSIEKINSKKNQGDIRKTNLEEVSILLSCWDFLKKDSLNKASNLVTYQHVDFLNLKNLCAAELNTIFNEVLAELITIFDKKNI